MKNIANIPVGFGQNSFDDLDVFIATQFNVNVYVKYVSGENGPLWRPYIESIDKTMEGEFNYVYKDRWKAKMAAYVAALTYVFNKELPFNELIQEVFGELEDYDLKPDYKINLWRFS